MQGLQSNKIYHLLNYRTTPKSSKVKSEKSKSSGTKKSGKKKDGKGEDDTDSEEERWLDAIESGKLEEVKYVFVQHVLEYCSW